MSEGILKLLLAVSFLAAIVGMFILSILWFSGRGLL